MRVTISNDNYRFPLPASPFIVAHSAECPHAHSSSGGKWQAILIR